MVEHVEEDVFEGETFKIIGEDELIEYGEFEYEAEEAQQFESQESLTKSNLVPPDYRSARGRYEQFCTCSFFKACGFCKWFSLVKKCKAHRRKTKFTPCVCLDKHNAQRLHEITEERAGDAELTNSSNDLTKFDDLCRCPKEIKDPFQLIYKEWVKAAKSGSEEYGEEEELMNNSPESVWRKPTHAGTCRCKAIPKLRTESSTELDGDVESIDLLSSSSEEDLIIGAGLIGLGDSSEHTSSEDSCSDDMWVDVDRLERMKKAAEPSAVTLKSYDKIELIGEQMGEMEWPMFDRRYNRDENTSGLHAFETEDVEGTDEMR